jgi:general L-amino acid transport system permease protein
VLPEVISKEPLGPMVRHGDDQWFDIVKWTLYAMVNAEELGVTQKNVDEMAKSDKPELKRVFGTDGNLGEQLGLTKDWVSRIVKAVGNYGESFDRNVGAGSKLGLPAASTSSGTRAEFSTRRRSADRSQGLRRWPSNPENHRRSSSPGCGARSAAARAGAALSLQILFVAALAWIAYEIVANARANLQAQRITAGFGFLANTAGFDVSQSLIPYSGSDTYTRVFLVGLLNTLLVSVIGIFFATMIGFLVALGRLSPNWLLSRISGGYVELIRNLPLLFQILFWYLAVLAALPNPRQSISMFGSFFLSNRGLVIPKPIGDPGFEPFVVAVLIAIVASLLLRATRAGSCSERQADQGLALCAGLLIGLPLLSALIFGRAGHVRNSGTQGFQFFRRLARHSGIRGADAGAVDLHRGLHRRDRARRHSVGSQGADGSGSSLGLQRGSCCG